MTADPQVIADKARILRRDIIEMIAEAGSGHPGGSLSSAEIVATLFFGGILRYRADEPDWPDRDRFVLSKGHVAPVLYSALAEAGYFGRDHLSTLRKLGSILQGHPDSTKCPGIEVSSGSLGQGLAVANGIALGLRLDGRDSRVYCLLGDGELQEGEVWEAAMFSSQYRLANLTAIVDHNEYQIDGSCTEVMCLGDVESKFAAFGWETTTVDGHDPAELIRAFAWAQQAHGPAVIVAKTVKGKGVSFMENTADWHGKAPSPEETARALAEIAGEVR